LTRELHELFEGLSGSHNPLHTDDEFARAKGFKERIGYGFLTLAMLSKMTGEHLPGRFGMCRAISCEFRRPVYIGDTLTYSGVLTEVRKSVRQVTVEVTVTNQHGELVANARMLAGVSE